MKIKNCGKSAYSFIPRNSKKTITIEPGQICKVSPEIAEELLKVNINSVSFGHEVVVSFQKIIKHKISFWQKLKKWLGFA